MDRREYKVSTSTARLQRRVEVLEWKLKRMQIARQIERRFISRFEDRIPRDINGAIIDDVDKHLWSAAARRVGLDKALDKRRDL